jgi:hypothetical protein
MRQSAFLHFLRLAAAVLAIVYLGGCASFDPRWRAADGTAKSRDATRWDGRWSSAKHHALNGGPEGGRLRCVVEKADSGRLDAHFHANFLCFSGNYSVRLEPKPRGAKMEYRGTQELPQVFGGTYWYVARITKDRFLARYDSDYDNGTFDLRRVK